MSGRSGRRNGRFRRRSDTAPRAVAAPPALSSRRSRISLALALLGGMLIGRFAFALLPLGARTVFDFVIAAGFALALALAYRAYMRRYMAEQRRRRG